DNVNVVAPSAFWRRSPVDSNRAATKTARKILLRITANLTNVFCSEKRATTDANVAFLFSALREGFRTRCYSSTPALKSATGNATRNNVLGVRRYIASI